MNRTSFRAAVSVLFGLMVGCCDHLTETAARAAEPTAGLSFRRDVAPLLVSRCLECHRGASAEGSLRLDTAEGLASGGDSGTVVSDSDLSESLLWRRVAADEMPPEHPLPAAEKEILAAWINAGHAWEGGPLDPFAFSTDSRAGRDWWSLQPIVSAPPPDAEAHADWPRGPIDRFVLQRLLQEGLSPAPQADPSTLLRRLFFDLTGLPPSPEEIDAFAADPSDDAYEAIVEKLLASPAYGERWGRHWLDVVRYGESDGFERNFQREHAWPYRDWVIRALNEDMPYDEFVRRQLVGDQTVGGREGSAATGFWVAGIHNTVVGGSERMKQLARQDELEDVLGTIGQTFVGLTFNCARCHDHKFDPVSQREYYQLASTISGLGFGKRTVELPDEQLKLAAIDSQLEQLRRQLGEIESLARQRVLAARDPSEANRPAAPAAIARWEFETDYRDSIGSLHGEAFGAPRLEDGALVLDGQSFVASPPLDRPLGEKTLTAWIQLERFDQAGGGAITVETLDGGVFDAIVYGEQTPRRWMAGSNNFARTRPFSGSDEVEAVERPVHVALVYRADGSITGYRDGLPYGNPITPGPLQSFAAGNTEVLFGLRHRPGGGNRYLKGRLHAAALYDRPLSQEEVARDAASGTAFVAAAELIEALTEAERGIRSGLREEITAAQEARDTQAARASLTIDTLVPGPGQEMPLLGRGDPEQAGEIVPPGTTAAIPTLPADFGLAPDAAEVERRMALADWITHENNPLFARVIVNRVWHHHFGTGLVNTPSDFGFNGGRPSHPQLLEFLASSFRENGQSLKWLHREIVRSAAYRQTSRPDLTDSRGASIDADNRLLWKGPVRRLEAEAIRDSMLAVAGVLEPKRGGPGFRDVSITLNNGTTYYEPIDAYGPEVFRRTVYRFSPRGSRPALLETFDCPDPSATAPKRGVTTTPLQALSLLNNPFVLRVADHFAERVARDAVDSPHARIERAWRLAIGRGPTDQERQLSERLVEQHGLPALCRGLFNTNAFVVID
jgi:hypothetical protein